jgi:hypothetical protein
MVSIEMLCNPAPPGLDSPRDPSDFVELNPNSRLLLRSIRSYSLGQVLQPCRSLVEVVGMHASAFASVHLSAIARALDLHTKVLYEHHRQMADVIAKRHLATRTNRLKEKQHVFVRGIVALASNGRRIPATRNFISNTSCRGMTCTEDSLQPAQPLLASLLGHRDRGAVTKRQIVLKVQARHGQQTYFRQSGRESHRSSLEYRAHSFRRSTTICSPHRKSDCRYAFRSRRRMMPAG